MNEITMKNELQWHILYNNLRVVVSSMAIRYITFNSNRNALFILCILVFLQIDWNCTPLAKIFIYNKRRTFKSLLNMHNTIEDIILHSDLNVLFWQNHALNTHISNYYKVCITLTVHVGMLIISTLSHWSVRMKKNHISYFKLVLKKREKV